MIEDMRHMEIFEAFNNEIEALLIEYNERSNGKTNKEELIELRLEQNSKLVSLLAQHKRALYFMAGKQIDPQVHFGEAIVQGTFGGSA